jgi:hypothetical protein
MVKSILAVMVYAHYTFIHIHFIEMVSAVWQCDNACREWDDVVGVHPTCATCPLDFAQQAVCRSLGSRSGLKQSSLEEKCNILGEG